MNPLGFITTSNVKQTIELIPYEPAKNKVVVTSTDTLRTVNDRPNPKKFYYHNVTYDLPSSFVVKFLNRKDKDYRINVFKRDAKGLNAFMNWAYEYQHRFSDEVGPGMEWFRFNNGPLFHCVI